MGESKAPGQSLLMLCETRRTELQHALAQLSKDGAPQTRKDIEAALAGLAGLLTGELEHIPPVVTERLSKWLDQTKYLGLKEQREMAVAAPVAPEEDERPASLIPPTP